MVAKLRGNFLPKDYQISLYKPMENIKQILMIVREYAYELYRINMRGVHIEETVVNIEMHVNGLRMDIQDEMSMLSPNNINQAYQIFFR